MFQTQNKNTGQPPPKRGFTRGGGRGDGSKMDLNDLNRMFQEIEA